MTPKERAAIIWEKMFYLIETNYVSKDADIATKCALFCVDEIIKELVGVEVNYDLDFGDNILYYWSDVKKEIELI